jgi:hypothetical protein
MSSNNVNDYSLLDSQYETVSSTAEESINPVSDMPKDINYENSENSMDNYIATKINSIAEPKKILKQNQPTIKNNQRNESNLAPVLSNKDSVQSNKVNVLSNKDSVLSNEASIQSNQVLSQQKKSPPKEKKVRFAKSENNQESKTEQKYGDDSIYESWADNAIFFPLSDKLVTPLRDIGLTPNSVTYLSTACTFLSIYYLSIKKVNYAGSAYFLGYLLDCVDGRMARKFKMSSQYGMMIDLVSDNVTNLALFSFFIYKHGFLNWFVPILFFMTYMLGLSYGINEAIASYKATGSDNFFAIRQNEIGETNNILHNTFLLVTGLSYKTYKQFFPEYNEERIKKWLTLIKHFGPGNYCLFVIALMLVLEW